MGNTSRPYIGPRRVTLIGRDHTWTAPMSDMQRERAEPPLQPVRPEPLWHSIAAGLGLTVAAVSLVLASAWLS